MTLSRTGQTVQLRATAAFPTGPDPQAQTVTAIATWQSSNPAVAAVSGGLVTAVAVGTLTVTATHQGKAGTLNLTVALSSVMTAALSETTTPFVWSTDVTGGSGTTIVSTLTSTSASATFSLTLAPARRMPTDTKVVTNGVFHVLF